jgi:hypothetical protein
MEKLKCKCGKLATWIYIPSEHEDWVCCDDCVPRGCACWEWYDKEYNPESYEEPEGIEGKDWEWIQKNKSWRELDGKGQQLPCIEWFHNEKGWKKDV